MILAKIESRACMGMDISTPSPSGIRKWGGGSFLTAEDCLWRRRKRTRSTQHVAEDQTDVCYGPACRVRVEVLARRAKLYGKPFFALL